MKIPARRVEYSLTESALFPFQAEPTQVLVEGETEKHSLPYLLGKLGHDCERDNIAVIAASGKDKLKFLIRACIVSNLDWIALYDTDTNIKAKIGEFEKNKSFPAERVAALKEQDKPMMH